ncbi:MAG: sigma-70 family RNA polymerase sigma factor [bacterium]
MHDMAELDVSGGEDLLSNDVLEPSIHELELLEFEIRKEEIAEKVAQEDVDFASDDIHLKYIREIKRYPKLSRDDVVELAKRKDDGDMEARNMLTCCNLLLVVKFARRFIGRGLDFSELIQEGNIGLLKAVELFDWKRGFMFSTYAVWQIKQSIIRAIHDKSNTIRLPVHRMLQLNAYRKAMHLYVQEHGETPSDEIVCDKMSLSHDDLREIMLDISLTQNNSLNNNVGDDGTEFGDFIGDEKSVNFEFNKDDEKMRAMVEEFGLYQQVIIRYRLVEKIPVDKISSRFGIPAWQIIRLEREVRGLVMHKIKRLFRQ